MTIFIGAALLLILPTIPYRISFGDGLIPQWMGLMLVLFIPVYIFILIRQEKSAKKAKKLSAVTAPDLTLEKPEGM